MKILKLIALSILLSSFYFGAQAQDTTKKTTIISSDTTVIRKDSSNARKAQVKPAPVVAPAAAPAPAPAPAAPAQDGTEYAQVGFHLGLRFQPGFAAVSSANSSNSVGISGRVGYGYGVSLAYYYNNYWGTQLELMYSTLSQDVTEKGFSRTVNLNYISIPLLATLNTNYGKPVNFNIALGPQFGLLAGSSVSGNDNNFNANVSAKGLDFGVAFGGGLDFALGPKHHTHINLGYRGVQGLLDIDNSGGAVQQDNNYYLLRKAKTGSNSIYLGIMFKL
jgi:hypothetical protein